MIKFLKFSFLSTSTEVYLPLRAGHSQHKCSPHCRRSPWDRSEGTLLVVCRLPMIKGIALVELLGYRRMRMDFVVATDGREQSTYDYNLFHNALPTQTNNASHHKHPQRPCGSTGTSKRKCLPPGKLPRLTPLHCIPSRSPLHLFSTFLP